MVSNAAWAIGHQQREGNGHPTCGRTVRQRAPGDARVVDGAVFVGDVGQHARAGAAVHAAAESAATAESAVHHDTSSFSRLGDVDLRPSPIWITSSGSASWLAWMSR